jgi:hypothetical protein
MMRVRGPIAAVRLQGLWFDCAGIAATALHVTHAFNSVFSDLMATRYTGPAYIVDAFSSPTGVAKGCDDNLWTNVQCLSPAGSSAYGLVMGTSSGGGLGVSRNTFIGCLFTRSNDAATASILLRYCDANTFINTIAQAHGAGTLGVGVRAEVPSGASQFPGGIAFYNCPILGGTSQVGTWTGVNGIGFFPYPTGDSEPVPSAPIFYGITDEQEVFGWARRKTSSGEVYQTAFTQTVAAIPAGTFSGDLFRSYGSPTQDDKPTLTVPSGKTLKVISASIRAVAGSAGGTYTVKALLKNVSNGTYAVLATATGPQNAELTATAYGTHRSPLASLVTLTRWNLVLLNDSSSPGALADSTSHLCTITYVYE